MSKIDNDETAEPQPTVKYLAGKIHKILVVDGHKFYIKNRHKTMSIWRCRFNKPLG